MTRTLLLCLTLASLTGWAQRHPPPPPGHWALDETGQLRPDTLGALDAVAAEVDAAGAGQLGVLVTRTTQGHPSRAFATAIFNAWGIGHAGVNDGMFLFVAVADRKSEIVLGKGSQVGTATTDRVMRDDVVANMKRGDLDGALLSAARDLAQEMKRAARGGALKLTGTTTVPAPVAARTDETLRALAMHEMTFPERSPRSWVVDLGGRLSASQRAQLDVVASDVYAESKGRLFFLVVDGRAPEPDLTALVTALLRQVEPLSSLPVAVVAWDERSSALSLRVPAARVTSTYDTLQLQTLQASLADQVNANRTAGLQAAGQALCKVLRVGFPPRPMAEVLQQGFREHAVPVYASGLAGLLGLVAFGRRWNRRRTRYCEHCHGPRELLSEAEEDAYLSAAEQTEESIGAVSYDVWLCGRCNDTLVLDYSSLFSSYAKCPKCARRTKTSSSTTLISATEYQEGEVRIDESCMNCDYSHSYTRYTSRLSSSSSSDSSWSSSSSSDSSFGGGSSDGGGSSGSW